MVAVGPGSRAAGAAEGRRADRRAGGSSGPADPGDRQRTAVVTSRRLPQHPSLSHLRDDPGPGSLAARRGSSPMIDAVIDEVRGRRIRIGRHWLADFASCNYLGFDLDPQIAAAITDQVARWGTHPSWSRLLGNPRLYPR